MSEAQDTMRRIAMGGDTGRRAFLRLWLNAAIVEDADTANRLYQDVLPKIWEEQDRSGKNNGALDDRFDEGANVLANPSLDRIKPATEKLGRNISR